MMSFVYKISIFSASLYLGFLPVTLLIGGFVPPWGVCNVPPASLYVLVKGKGENVLFCPFINTFILWKQKTR